MEKEAVEYLYTKDDFNCLQGNSEDQTPVNRLKLPAHLLDASAGPLWSSYNTVTSPSRMFSNFDDVTGPELHTIAKLLYKRPLQTSNIDNIYIVFLLYLIKLLLQPIILLAVLENNF